MKKACLVVQRPYQNNEIFNPESSLNRDNCLEFFHELRQQFLRFDIDLQTQDKVSMEEAVFILFNEMPAKMSEVCFPEKSAVMLFESNLIRPENWILKNHEYFKTIFTWSDDFVDNQKYFKFNFTGPRSIPFKSFFQKTKFCTLIAGNKYVNHPLELYSKRVETIRWFEANHSEKFEFYGIGWSTYVFKFKIQFISRILNRIKPVTRHMAEKWKSYRGPVMDKLMVLQDYKFLICYENARDINGYITEKVLDAFAAGCIPIYWGAPNISDFIPKECIVNRGDFATHESLYSYLVNMDESEYNFRLNSIKLFLEGEKSRIFRPDFNARIVVERLTNVQSR